MDEYKELPDQFKDFLYCQRKVDLGERYLHLHVNIAVLLYQYMQAFDEIKFEDGKYYKYAGQLKTVVNNFIQFWSEIMNEILQTAEKLVVDIDSGKLLQMIDVTLEVQAFKQRSFTKLFLPCTTPLEKKLFEEIRTLYRAYVRSLQAMKEKVTSLDKPEQARKFAEVEFDRSVRRRNEVFKMAHNKIAIRLAQNCYKIKTSLEEKRKIAKQNLEKLRADHYNRLNKLLDKLYDANKEKVKVSRQDKHRDSDSVEVEKSIKEIRDRIEGLSINKAIENVEEELRYWTKRLEDFLTIDQTLVSVGDELHNVNEFLKEYGDMRTSELPGSAKKKCWDTMADNYLARKEYLEETYMEASKALLTFFAVRGRNRILYTNHIGKYAVDDYGHQVYVFHYGRDNFHVKCDGSYIQYADTFRYLFDENGRYVVNENGEKMYKRSYCASLYKLNDHLVLEKVTPDCGHSTVPNPDCKMLCKDPNDIELLPKVDPVDIRRTLKPEVTQYLWSELGHVLWGALFNVASKNSKNPIYHLANELIQQKYRRTHKEMKKLQKEAAEYRVTKREDKKQKLVTATKAWKAKQVSRRKPEESDDTQELAARAHLEQQQLLRQYAEQIS